MPTGYTSDVENGKITELRDYAFRCARAFDPLSSLRDTPMDAPLPAKITPSHYHAERLLEEENRLRALLALTPAEVQEAYDEDLRTRLIAWANRRHERALYRQRYQDMIDKVRAWQPPEEYAELKSFMLEQLNLSRGADCSVSDKYDPSPVRGEASEWLAQSLEDVRRDIDYYEKKWRDGVAKAEADNLWLDALRAALV